MSVVAKPQWIIIRKNIAKLFQQSKPMRVFY